LTTWVRETSFGLLRRDERKRERKNKRRERKEEKRIEDGRLKVEIEDFV